MLVVYLAAYFVSLSLILFYMGVLVSVFYVLLLIVISIPKYGFWGFHYPLVALCSTIA